VTPLRGRRRGTLSRIYALLLDRYGRLLWSVDGPYDDTKGRALKAALAALVDQLSAAEGRRAVRASARGRPGWRRFARSSW
jgi:hypothetical protein